MTTVLIVDDSETMRDQIREDLQTAGYDVLEGENGEQGLEVTAHNAVDLVITDFNMPVMDGLSMCKHMNAQDNHKKIPIFMLTTQSRPDLKLEAKEAGVIAWIIKPYKKDALLKATNKVCSR